MGEDQAEGEQKYLDEEKFTVPTDLLKQLSASLDVFVSHVQTEIDWDHMPHALCRLFYVGHNSRFRYGEHLKKKTFVWMKQLKVLKQKGSALPMQQLLDLLSRFRSELEEIDDYLERLKIWHRHSKDYFLAWRKGFARVIDVILACKGEKEAEKRALIQMRKLSEQDVNKERVLTAWPLALCCLEGKGGKFDPSLARRCCELILKRKTKQEPDAALLLSYMHCCGVGVPKDLKKGFDYHKHYLQYKMIENVLPAQYWQSITFAYQQFEPDRLIKTANRKR